MIHMDKVLKPGFYVAVLCLALGCSSTSKKQNNNNENSNQPKNVAKESSSSKRLYEDALNLEAEGNYADAFARYKEIESNDAEFMDVKDRLEGYRDLVDMQQEIALLQEESEAQRAIYRVEFASLLRQRGADYRDQARVQYMKAAELDKTNFDAHYGLGSLYLEATYYDKAIEHFEQAVASESDQYSKKSDAYFQLAFLYRTYAPKKDAAKAEENAKYAVEYSSGEGLEKRRLFAEVLMSNGKKDEAMKVAEEIVAREGSTDADKARVDRFTNGKTQEAMMPKGTMDKAMDDKKMDGKKMADPAMDDKKMDDGKMAEPAMDKKMDDKAMDKKMDDKKMDAPASQPAMDDKKMDDKAMDKKMDDKKMDDKKMDAPASQPANN